MSADALLDALDPDQRAVATALTGPVCVLAGAGTGKTRAITHRIAYGVRTGTYRPSSVLAVTFTARAAGEMRMRLRDLGATGVQARTFHSAALRQLTYFWPKVVGGAPPRLLEHKAPAVADAARRLGLEVDRVAVRDLASEIEWAKVSLVAADDYERAVLAAGRALPEGYDARTLARLLTAYEDVKTERHVMDFEDVLLLLGAVLSERADVTEQVRAQYRHFVVDEYQDVSPLQQFLLDQWLGGRQELCVVGDPSQTIYSFTGATPHHLLTFARTHPGATVVRLVRDYRSTPQVVALANRVLAVGRRPADVPPLELVAQRPDGPAIRYAVHEDDESEARAVATRIARLAEAGARLSEIAVLYRTNAQSEVLEQALASAGIGYAVRGGDRFFARREVRDALVLLRGGARSADPTDPMPQTVRGLLLPVGWAPEPPAARGAARERWDLMQALVALADELAETAARDGRSATVQDLVAELDERAAAQHAPTVEGVTLASLHAAKGLEWDVVFLVGLSDGLVPISLAEGEDAIAEERRLLYVGVTRARERLELSWARSRNPGGRASRSRTPFLAGIWPDDEQRRGRTAGGRGGREGSRTPTSGRPGVGGAALCSASAGPAPDAAVLRRLHAWRAEVARTTSKPAFTVLTDAVLEQVARTLPTTVRELALVDGVGAVKLQRFGPAVLDVVAGRGPAVGPRA
ncbi:ATP-dependent helicase [Cellulomonas marina]|uniref:DNA 3'-5' helicase n=1 Tax=Cellulomonas marina TaxID=988821 RepID=A0A1I1A292_9CELL|nr:ATP-dependent DNA helicase UvrD2 [Cellulomonas marina]SFB32061.1 DNA helicase-2 / ATP-dependent DNA helicase PcrA [Cellulomonas marina]